MNANKNIRQSLAERRRLTSRIALVFDQSSEGIADGGEREGATCTYETVPFDPTVQPVLPAVNTVVIDVCELSDLIHGRAMALPVKSILTLQPDYQGSR
jgi:hypothetical protein